MCEVPFPVLGQDPTAAATKIITPEFTARFWSHVTKSDGCWLWNLKTNSSGYGRIVSNGQILLAHRCAWELSYGPIPKGLFVCHRCDANYPIGDKSYRSCVRPDHLFLGTNKENIQDASKKGRMARGERSFPSKLSDTQVIEIRTRYAAGERVQSIADTFSIDTGSVSRIASQEYWRHLPPVTGIRIHAYARGDRHYGAKLTDGIVREVRRLRTCGESQQSIASRFGVSREAIRCILNGETWKYVV
jgi:hypothetical protein